MDLTENANTSQFDSFFSLDTSHPIVYCAILINIRLNLLNIDAYNGAGLVEWLLRLKEVWGVA